jgi:hypothetical protein
MSTPRTLTRIIAGALLSGGVAVAGLGLTAGTAQANTGPHRWCPGQSKNAPTGPGADLLWDWSVCHTYYFVDYGKGNVRHGYAPDEETSIWDGDNPPAPNPPPLCIPFVNCLPGL